MNAAIQPRASAAVPHATHRLRLLLRREFWEHKGGFFWAPAVAGGIFVLLSLMGIIVGLVAARKIPDGATINTDSGSFQVNGMNLAMLTDNVSAEDLREIGNAIDVSLFMAASWPLIVLAFVVFFYCLGSLYDERKDRSVLFWKSLPVSDAETVLSKVLSATLMAPVLAMAAGLLTMFAFLCLISIVVLFHGGNPITLLWGPSSPLTIAAQLTASIPIYAIWALPAVGWLMLCSAWAKSKPFLWAIMIPLFAGIFVSWFDLMQLFDQQSGWFWKHIVARMLLSVVPGSDIFYRGEDFEMMGDGIESTQQLLSLQVTYGALLRPETWIGAVAGVAMIFGAIRLRRSRDSE
jgi:ABC-2 type transport system permease protein